MNETFGRRRLKLGAIRRPRTDNRAALLLRRRSEAAAPPPKSSSGLVTPRGRLRGQAAVIIALSMLFIILMIGLAIDGGASYGLRRQAQNASDGSALAGGRKMLSYYEAMILANPDYDVPGTATQETDILNSIYQYAALNNVPTNTLQAYFVTSSKQVVSVASNPGGTCGSTLAQACQVGQNGEVPWELGAIGINIKSRAASGSSFMRLIGWDSLAASASATAFMGVGASQDDVSLVPIALFTDTTNINYVPGTTYTLLDADTTLGSGNWGWVDFNGSGTSATTVGAWLTCGFNPIVDADRWPDWCPSDRNAPGQGPTQHYRPVQDPSPPDNYDPESEPFFVSQIVYGPGRDGWWLAGSSGGVNANCQDFQHRINNGPNAGTTVLFPIFDRQISGGGNDTMYHVRVIVAFLLQQGDVGCHPYTPPTPTPCGLCPTPTPGPNGGGNREKWFIQGIAQQIYSRSSSGRIGNLRSASDHVVFLDN
jgi:Putative Flp pilus-assembly TadE/G-like